MRTRRNLIISAVMLTAYLLAANPLLTGIAFHEWISLGFALLAGLHLVLHRRWVASTLRRFLERLPRMSRLNAALDAVTAIAVTTVMVSGLAVSQTLSALAGLTYSTSDVWRALHAGSATAVVLSLVLHVALHWRWILTAARLHVVRPLSALLEGESVAAMAQAAAWGVPMVLFAGLLSLGVLAASGTAGASGFDPTAASVSGTLTCPSTGCTATTCHATGGTNGATQAQSASGPSSDGGTLTCPRTGCTATSCHATSGGGRGSRHGS